MSDQGPDPTALDDDQLDSLLDALAERAAQRDDLDLPGSGASRRGVLAGLLGLGGAAAGAGVASAIGESESYGSASGVVGSDSEPLNEANVQDLHAQDAQIDNLLEAKQVSGGGSPLTVTDALSAVLGSGTGVIYQTDSFRTEVVHQETTVPNTSETVILSDPSGVAFAGVALVRVDAGSGNKASDLVLAAAPSGDTTTIASVTQGSPPTRTYTGGANDELAVTLGSGSAEVTAWGVNQFA